MNEKALLLIVYSFLLEAITRCDLDPLGKKRYGRLIPENTLKLITVFRKLKQLHKSYANPKVRDFLIKKVEDPGKKYVIDIVYVAILLLYFYRIADIKRKITPISVKDAKELLYNILKEDLTADEVMAARDIFISLYPNKEVTTEFIKERILKEIDERENCQTSLTG